MSKYTKGYLVMEYGGVLSILHNWRGYGRRELKQDTNAYGYKTARLTINGKRKKYFVHKLVAFYYLPPRPSKKHQLRHLDGCKGNNKANNLAWGTAQDNANDREKHGRTSRGLKHSKAIKRGFNHGK